MRTQDGHVQVLREVRGQMLRKGHEEGQVRRQEVRGQVRSEVHGKVRPQMRPQVRAQELTAKAGRQSPPSKGGGENAAALRLLETYAALAERGEHLFGDVLQGQMPRQWSHYPEDDAIDQESGFQWFYHSHAPQDRPGATEHGHIHLFARRPRWARRLRSAAELRFTALHGAPPASTHTRHLLALGFDARGLPTSLFTVNSWVTGDRMLNADLTAELLATMKLDTGHPAIDRVLECLVCLYREEIRGLLRQRDEALLAWPGWQVLSDEGLELLSELSIDVDAKLIE